MSKIQFDIPGKPVGKARARSTKSGHHFTPQKTKDYEQLVSLCARQAMAGQEVWQGAVELRVRMFVAPAASWPAWKMNQVNAGELMPTTKPDLDNVLKSIKDALNGVVYVDDSQVVSVVMDKRYGDNDRVEVTAWLMMSKAIQQATRAA